MPTAPGSRNAYIPALNGKLIVDYSRNPKDYAINQVAQIIPVDKQEGYWAKFDPTAHNRILGRENRIWYDGQPRPISEGGKQKHDFVRYRTERYTDTEPFGYLTLEQAEWDVIKQHSNVLASRAMTFRSLEGYRVLADTNNYPAAHTATATALGGGTWASATSANNYIQKSINAASRQILKATNSVVGKEALTMIMSPVVANAIAERPEIREAFIQSQFAESLIQGNGSFNINYGLPPVLYGVKVLVDPLLETTTNENVSGTATTDFAYWNNAVMIVARRGDLTNTGDLGTVFSTLGFFIYKNGEMDLEVFDDPVHKRKIVAMDDHFDTKVIAPLTAYQITAVLS